MVSHCRPASHRLDTPDFAWIIEECRENSHRIAAATDTCSNHVGQAAGHFQELLARLDSDSCSKLREEGVITGGMIPKVTSALGALRDHPSARIKIAPAAGADSIRNALRQDVGTRFLNS